MLLDKRLQGAQIHTRLNPGRLLFLEVRNGTRLYYQLSISQTEGYLDHFRRAGSREIGALFVFCEAKPPSKFSSHPNNK